MQCIEERTQVENQSEAPPSPRNENLDLKDVKPIDGVEYEWKQGKLSPVEQKSYRSKFDEH